MFKIHVFSLKGRVQWVNEGFSKPYDKSFSRICGLPRQNNPEAHVPENPRISFADSVQKSPSNRRSILCRSKNYPLFEWTVRHRRKAIFKPGRRRFVPNHWYFFLLFCDGFLDFFTKPRTVTSGQGVTVFPATGDNIVRGRGNGVGTR